jgi:glycosyltransferase involved in cell wall biosynthesis
MSKDLSILICTLNRRSGLLSRLAECLRPQINERVEVLVAADDGEITIGEKRNKLLEQATGKYVAFIDDDDMVSDKYIEYVLKAIDQNPDVIGIHLLMYYDSHLAGLTYHSLQYKEWSDRKSNVDQRLTFYYRNPNHINPIKKDLIGDLRFPHQNMSEDDLFSQALQKKIVTADLKEVFIHEPIYYYLVRTNKQI